tara:strand:+ start:1748 stop:2083 length:336 start_codon:yes stop_codon:yes gene_type:complete
MKFLKYLLSLIVIVVIVVVVISLISDTENITITDLDCTKLGDRVEGKEIQNAFGMKIEVLKIYEAKQISKSEDKLTCKGKALLSKGDEETLTYSYFKDSDGDWFYRMSTAD